MKIVTRLPHRYTATEDCRIPLSDGTTLAAKLWLPDIAATQRVPAIVEVIPYRKRDFTSVRDSQHHGYFAGHGYATLRIDIRGSGDSDGYQGVFAMRGEQQDTVEALDWIARQPWSDGQVALFGISWGGMQAVQAADAAPPQLKAIMPQSFAPDRYFLSQVFKGGCLLLRAIRWSAQMSGYKSRPPDPALVGERWRDMWLQRLAHGEPQLFASLEHQTYDAYWQSRAIDLSKLRVPMYAVSGWADGNYVGSVGQSVAQVRAPVKGLIGPWGHRFGHLGVPGPAIGYLQEALRWFDQHLRGRDTGILREPRLRAWIAESAPAKPWYAESPGRWVAEDEWPSRRIRAKRFALNAGGRLSTRAGKPAKLAWKSPQTVGLACGELMPWFVYGASPELPGDQRADDGGSLTFDTEPLAAGFDILGGPVAHIALSVDRPVAMLCVRLCDVAPDGASTRVSYGVLNLTHRDGHERAKPLVPGRRYTVRVPLDDTGYRFAKGHRVRVAVSTSYWPLVWPSPEPVTLTLVAGASSIELPVRPPNPRDRRVPPFGPAEAAPAIAKTQLSPGSRNRVIRTDLGTGETVVEIADTAGRARLVDIDLVTEARSLETYRVREDDPLAASAEVTWLWSLERGDWRVRTEGTTTMTCTKRDFIVRAELRGYEGDALAFEQRFERTIPRDGN